MRAIESDSVRLSRAKSCQSIEALVATVHMDRNTRKLLQGTLIRLRDYMKDFYPNRDFGTRFWEIEDDDLFFEALGYLPLHMPKAVMENIDRLSDMPRGYRLAFPIFWIEDDYFVNGWTALSNAGEWLLPAAIDAYREIAMPSEADALQAALSVIRRGESGYDDDAIEAAYKSIPNEYADEEKKDSTLLRFFRSDSDLFDFEGA